MVHKAPLVALSMNLLRPDAASLGNHEFDLGAKGLETYLNLTYGYPVVAANIDVSEEPGLLKQRSLKRSVVYRVNGRLIGIIGYVLPDTKLMAIANNITFNDEIKTIKREAGILKRGGVKILIALGHSGHNMDKKIAAEVKDIDIVVGGHSNTFLWNGKEPDSEQPKGEYPVQVKQMYQNKTFDLIVLQNAGGIRSNLMPYENSTVIYGMLMSVMPYESTLFKCEITGKQLKAMLEWVVTRYTVNNERGEFPQWQI
ncbi:protein 5NUC-like [Ctenocephalides felis]|uniref:protein 5NUC-like n=1 Tax=Ctenocephalides felis TaxID=7515 RepID=UPI000E6E5757|nr:protein 5NUC-like [Ctenocephalides felis]